MDFGDFVLNTRGAPDRRPGTLPRAVLFDLDGTLIDSVPDIALAVAELLDLSGLAPFDEDSIRAMVGHGVGPLVSRAFAAHGIELSPDEHERQIGRMRDIYPRHLTGRTTLMPHAREALAGLRQRDVPLALVTNKLQSAANIVLDHFGLAESFSVVLGDQARPGGLAAKPAPDMLQFTLSRLRAQPGEAIMVGDSAADIEAARAAGVFCVALRNGYSSVPLEELAPDIIIDSLGELDLAIDTWRLG